MFNGLRDRRAKNFFSATNTDNTGVNVNWGIRGIDRDVNPSGGKFNRWIPGQNRGTVVWDDSFSIATPAAQQWVLDTCTLLERNLGAVRGKVRIQISCGAQDGTHLPTNRLFHAGSNR